MNIYQYRIRNGHFLNTSGPLLELLPPGRKEKILRYRFEEDRQLSLASSLLLFKCLREEGGFERFPDLQYGPNGKPSLPGSSVFFNLSHSGSLILLAVSRKGETGIDTECKKDAPFEVMDYFFHERERSYVNERQGKERTSAFYRIWTRKEALLKGLGTGLRDDMCRMNTLDPGLENRLISWEDDENASSVWAEKEESLHFHTVEYEDLLRFFSS